MDLTKLPQEILYFTRKSIDDFDIDNGSSADGIIYNNIVNLPLSVPTGWDKEKVILTIFNDAYYLITNIIIDDRFSLHTHLWIHFYDAKWNDDLIVSIIMGMVEYYISYTLELPHHTLKSVNNLMNDYKREKEGISNIDMTLFKKGIKPNSFLFAEHFRPIDIIHGLLKYNTFSGDVKWAPITKNFEINDIIRVVRILGSNLEGQRLILGDIFRDFKTDENRDYCTQGLFELISILNYHLSTKGELLNKKQLLKEYDEEQKRQEEFFQAEIEAMENGDLGPQKKEYEKKILNLEEEICQLKTEKEELVKRNHILEAQQLEEKEPEKAFNSHTGKPCFTNRQMGILLTAVGKMTEEENPPGKTTLGEIVEKISGYKSTTASTNMKGAIPKDDTEIVAAAIESKFPNLAKEVRKLAI